MEIEEVEILGGQESRSLNLGHEKVKLLWPSINHGLTSRLVRFGQLVLDGAISCQVL